MGNRLHRVEVYCVEYVTRPLNVILGYHGMCVHIGRAVMNCDGHVAQIAIDHVKTSHRTSNSIST